MKTNHNYYAQIVFLSLFLILSGCANINPFASADTPEQQAYAAYGTYIIFIETAADLTESPVTPHDAKLRLIHATQTGRPVADDLFQAVQTYIDVQTEFRKGETTEEQMFLALEMLVRYLDNFDPVLTKLVTTVNGAR